MIVDFEQDPNAPYGSGNFRDEAGRITYLHDPDTASLFNKTMKGSTPTPAKSVADESTAIAKAAMGGAAPAAGPDTRLAMNDTGEPVPVGDLSVPAPPMPNTAPPTASDTATMSVSPAETQSLGGPNMSTAPLSKPAQLVEAASKIHTKPAATPAPAATALPPISGTSTTQNTSIARGRSSAAVDTDIAAREQAGAAVDTSILDAGKTKDEAVDAALGKQSTAATLRAVREQSRIDEAKRLRQRAIEDKTRVEAALKKNDESLDPERYMRSMSTGKHVAMTILAALNGAFGALIGQKDNGVIMALNKSIDADIDRQKQEIASGRIRYGNQIQEFMNEGHDQATAEKMARDRLDASLDQVAEIEAKRMSLSGENLAQAQLLIAQRKEARAAQRGDLLAQKEDKVQEATARVTERSVPKPVNSLEQLLQLTQYESAQLKLGNERVAQADARELSGQIYGTDDKGVPLKMLNPDQVKEVKDKIATVGPALAETAGAVNMTDVLVQSLGGHLDKTTGAITWGEGDEVKGAGPVDKRGGYLGLNPLGYGLRKAGLWRADVDKVRDAQNALKEYVTSQLTGANSNLRQDQTFGTMVGGDLSNEEQVRENVQNWTNTLFAARNQHETRLGEAGMRLQRRLESQAKAGAQAEPLKPRVVTGARGTSVIPEEPTMSVSP